MMQPDGATGLRDPRSFIPEMESLRGWAILLVVAFHYFGPLYNSPSATNPFWMHTADTDPFWLHIAAAGNTGVVLFFVLSGFLLTKPFIQAQREGRSVGILRFYFARALRILPLYYAFVCLAWVVTGKADVALRAFLFQPVGFEMAPFSVPWWTLCTEVQFYLLLPWLLLPLQFRLGRLLVGGGLMVWLAVHVYFFHKLPWLNNLSNWPLQASLFGRGPAFLIGMGCAWFHSSARYNKVFGSRARVWVGLIILLAGLYALLRWYAQTGQLPALRALPMFHNIEAVFWGAILLCCMSLQGRGKRFFINPVISHFGVLSYSIYLVHVPVQSYLISWSRDNPEHWLAAMGASAIIAVSFILIWGLSLMTYYGIEKPFLKLKARIPTFYKQQERSEQKQLSSPGSG